MSAKYYVCSHCGATNKVDTKDFVDAVQDNAVPIAKRAAIILAATALTAPLGGIGGIVAGAVFTAEGARDYITLACGNCGQRFFVNRLE